MTNNKLSIFIGSPKTGLESVRTTVITAIAEAGHIPSGMELWAAGHKPVPEAISHHLRDCDIHIVLLGTRYGSIIPGQAISYTEYEYLESKLMGRPVIAFLIDEAQLNADLREEHAKLAAARKAAEKRLASLVRRNAPASQTSEAQQSHRIADQACELATQYQSKLRRLREELQKKAIVRFFDQKDPDRIANIVTTSIAEARQFLPEEAGWIRATKIQAKMNILERNDILSSIVDRICQFSTLTGRLQDKSVIKRYMGNAFWDIMLGRIIRKRFYNVFFESGSTLAYIADEFHAVLRLTRHDSDPEWRVLTNNVIVLLQLQLQTALSVTTLPSGVPENRYGAILDTNLLRPHDDPPRKPGRLFEDELTAIKDFHNILKTYTPCLYLISASGLDLVNSDEHLRGPHVGGQPHMLIKHAIFRSGQPVVLFLDEGKLSKPFQSEKCFPVFGPDYPLRSICRRNPLAVCLGYAVEPGASPEETRAKRVDELTKVFPDLIWSYGYRQSEGIGVLLGANSKFIKVLEGE